MKLLLITLLTGWTTLALSAEQHVMKIPGEMEWKEGPKSLPAGAKMAVLSGDPAKKGLFTIRLQFPANYRIMPHWHPTSEHVTVIEGTLNMGAGDKMDETKGHALPPGGYAVMPMKFHHYAFTTDQPAIVQVHAMGPFEITYLDPANDPRKKTQSKTR